MVVLFPFGIFKSGDCLTHLRPGDGPEGLGPWEGGEL